MSVETARNFRGKELTLLDRLAGKSRQTRAGSRVQSFVVSDAVRAVRTAAYREARGGRALSLFSILSRAVIANTCNLSIGRRRKMRKKKKKKKMDLYTLSVGPESPKWIPNVKPF